MDKATKWVSVSHLPGYEWRLNSEGHRETRPIEPNYPPAGTWDVIDRRYEPRYVVEHDGKGGWWGVCQPNRPEDCYVLAASKEMREALIQIKQRVHFIGWPSEARFEDGTPDWSKEISMLEAALAKAEGK